MRTFFWLDEDSPGSIRLFQLVRNPGRAGAADDTSVRYNDGDDWPAHPPVSYTHLVAQLLDGVKGFRKVVVNAAAYEDVKVFLAGYLKACAAGKRFMFRTAAAVPKLLGGVADRPLLTREDVYKRQGYAWVRDAPLCSFAFGGDKRGLPEQAVQVAFMSFRTQHRISGGIALAEDADPVSYTHLKWKKLRPTKDAHAP